VNDWDKVNSSAKFQIIVGWGGVSPAGEGWLECNLLFHGALLEENNLQSTADKQAAEKGLNPVETPEKHPSWPKGPLILRYLRHD
jgi:hypothetical protein